MCVAGARLRCDAEGAGCGRVDSSGVIHLDKVEAVVEVLEMVEVLVPANDTDVSDGGQAENATDAAPGAKPDKRKTKADEKKAKTEEEKKKTSAGKKAEAEEKKKEKAREQKAKEEEKGANDDKKANADEEEGKDDVKPDAEGKPENATAVSPPPPQTQQTNALQCQIGLASCATNSASNAGIGCPT
jgi:hypothetical protein